MEKLNCIQKEFQIWKRWKIDGWKTFENNNPRIALNILCIKEKEVCPA